MKPNYITWRNYSFLITGLLIALIYFYQCEPEGVATVSTPEIKGKLPTAKKASIVQKPIYMPTGTIGKTGIPQNSDNSDLSDSLQVYKDELDFTVDRYTHETDSLKKLLLFKEAIALKSFTTNFEDDFLKLELNGIVSGSVKKITPTYTIKPQKVDVKVPEVKFRFLAGGGFGVNKDFNQTTYKANIGWQKKSGNIYRISYLNVNGQPFGMFETDIPIFAIKR